MQTAVQDSRLQKNAALKFKNLMKSSDKLSTVGNEIEICLGKLAAARRKIFVLRNAGICSSRRRNLRRVTQKFARLKNARVFFEQINLRIRIPARGKQFDRIRQKIKGIPTTHGNEKSQCWNTGSLDS